MSDAYAQALADRRGGGLDPALTAPAVPGPDPVTPSPAPQPAAMPPLTGQAPPALSPPTPAQVPVVGKPEDDIAQAITGGADENEYKMLKDLKPRSLGERVKMDTLKTQYEPRSQKNG